MLLLALFHVFLANNRGFVIASLIKYPIEFVYGLTLFLQKYLDGTSYVKKCPFTGVIQVFPYQKRNNRSGLWGHKQSTPKKLIVSYLYRYHLGTAVRFSL